MNDDSSTLTASSTINSVASSTAQRNSYSSTNLQNLEQQLNSIYNGTPQEFANANRLPNATPSNTAHQFQNSSFNRTNFNFSGNGQKKYGYDNRQRSHSLPQTNTLNPYAPAAHNNAYDAYQQNAHNSRLPINNFTNAYANSQQYQHSQNDRVNSNVSSTNMNYDSQFASNNFSSNNSNSSSISNNPQVAAYPSYADNSSTQQYRQMSPQAGMPSPAAGTTAPVSNCHNVQQLASARRCNCSNQHCNSHYYNNESNDAATPSVGNRANNTPTWQHCAADSASSANMASPAQVQGTATMNYTGYRNMNQFNNNANVSDTNSMMSCQNGSEYMFGSENVNYDSTGVNTSVPVRTNYNCNHGHEQQSSMKYMSPHYDQSVHHNSQQQYLQQNQQFYQMQHNQQQQQHQQHRQQQNQQQQHQHQQSHQQQTSPFKTQQFSEYNQQIQQNFANRRVSGGAASCAPTKNAERESHTDQQPSLNMRPVAYERTLQYVEQCQMFSEDGTSLGESNMVINDLSSSLNSLFEENKFLHSMIN